MLKNSVSFNGIELASIFGDENIYNINESFISIGITIDTRILENGNIFLALKGENLDGHDLIKDAFEKGASACIAENTHKEFLTNEFPQKSFIFTNDNLEGFGKIANFHRRRFNYPVLAVGGSNGKTTTKEMIYSVLSQKYSVLRTHGNFNNKIGVPLMLLQMSQDYDMVVLEVGTNTPGEIFDLSLIVEPTHALITNIGKEHLEFLLDLDGVELEETYLLSQVRSTGFSFINYDDDRLRNYGHILSKFSTYGIHEHSQFRCSYELNENLNPILKLHNEENDCIINMQTIGYTSALNAIAASAVGAHFEISNDKIKQSLENFVPLSINSGYGRMALIKHNGIQIINDTYNSNPDSMVAALKNLEYIKVTGKKVAVLGDMRELGDAAFDEHCNVLTLASNTAEKVFITGDEMLKANETLKKNNILYFEDKNILSENLKFYLNDGDCVLIKGSRGMKMELIINNIIGI